MPPLKHLLWLALYACLWKSSLAGVRELRLPVPTSETIALVAREMGAATFEESIEDQQPEASESRRVIRRLSTGGQDIEDNEYQEYQGVMGRPGVDFPVLSAIPQTAFSCRAVRKPGYFADLDTDCQVFHICDGGRKISFLCPNGTIFRQSHLICDWWFRVDCGKSVEQYEESAEQLAADQRIYRDRAEAISRAMSGGGGGPSTTPRPAAEARDTHIDLPVFEAARQNYEDRQTARRQTSRRRPARPQTDDGGQNRQQPEPKSIDITRSDIPDRDDGEQQVLAETASFASSRQNRFGNQFTQEQYYKENSQPQQSSIQPSTPSTLNPVRTSFTTSSALSSITTSTSTAPQRNLRPGARLLPTSSQNNNFRTNPTRDNSNNQQGPSDNNNKPSNDFKNIRGNQRPQFGLSSGVQFPETSQNNLPRSNSLPSPQTNFARPSPDLTPPEPGSKQTQSNNNEPIVRQAKSQRPQSVASPAQTVYNSQGSQGKRGRLSDTAKKIHGEPANRFKPSSTTIATSVEPNAPRRQKQRRFTSTTQAPVFTVKLRPSKSFSFVELERSQTSTTPSVSQQGSLAPKVPNVLLDSQFDNSFNKISINNQAQSQSSISTQNWKFSESPITQEFVSEPQTQSTTTSTRAPSVNSFATVSSPIPSSSYSPTIPEQKTKTSTPFAVNVNDDENLDKIASYSNIDPAEINLLPSLQNSGGKSRHQIPESSGPNALHTLAIYYATSESDSASTPAYTSADTIPPQLNANFEETRSESHQLGEKSQNEQEQLISKPSGSGDVQLHKVSDEILLRSHSGSPDDEAEIDDPYIIIEATDTIKELPTVLTKATKDSYAFLFNDTKLGESLSDDTDDKPCCSGDDVFDLDAPTEITTEKSVDIKFDLNNDLDIEQSRGIVQPTKSPKKNITDFSSALNDLPDGLKLRDSSDLRELAQVFSRALSAYLEDPDSFRRILSEVRPTEPTNTNTFGTTLTLEESEDEVLDFSDASNTGAKRLNNDFVSEPKQNDSFNTIDVGQINDLVQLQDNSESDFAPGLSVSLVNSDNNDYYTTPTPTSLAADINLLSNEYNRSYSDSLTDNTLTGTAVGNDDGSGPRYGGFFNNSGTDATTYKTYGSELPESITEQPLSNLPYVTDAVFIEPTVDNSVSANGNNFPQTSNNIDIESIPEQLGIGPAADINSLMDRHTNCNDPTHEHNTNSADSHTPEVNPNIPFQTEEEIYGKEGDQEQVLIASGSQSFVSRDNFVRLLGSKEDGSKSILKQNQIPNNVFSQTVQTSSTTQATTKSRGAVKYGTLMASENAPDVSSFRRRPNKEVAFQSVNLGNGVTLERTKTVRFSTPEINGDFASVTPPAPPTEQVNFNPVSINEEIGLMPEEVVATTENPFQIVGNGDNVIRATTYHPSSSRTSDIEDRIPPRGSLRDSWQWTSNPIHNDEVTTSFDMQQPASRTSEFALSESDATNSLSNFTSTIFPFNETVETMKEDMLEQKAEEIFGKLNKTSADKLMDVMNQAESNMTVRRLVLLLVADPVGQERRSFEDSRTQLIQALLKTDTTPQPAPTPTAFTDRTTTVKKSDRPRSRTRAPTSSTTTTTTQTSSTFRSREAKSYRVSNPTTSSVATTSSPDPPQRPEAQYLRSPNLFPQNLSASSFGTDPDARAVELLKSLYNIAARWG